MAGLAVDGLVSGMDTTALINSLMQLEAIPQTLLKKKASTTQIMITALQGLNTKVAALATLATAAAKPQALELYSASSTSAKVSVTAGPGAGAGQIDVTVGKLAQAQVTVTGPVTQWPSTSLTITKADLTEVVITAKSTSLNDMVTAINDSTAGVRAMKVAAGTDAATGEPLFRLQLSSAATGAAGAFTIDAAVPSTTTKDASNAEVTLWAGTAAAQTVTSATNTFAELLPGVSVTVSAASVDPVTVTVYRDTVKASKVAEDMVSSLNEVLAHISLKSVVTTSATDGVTSVNGGPFTGDSTVRETRQRLVNAASAPVNGSSPSEIGISITKTGVLEFDATKFAKALADDPAKVSSMMQEIASRVADKAGEASNKTDGLLTSKITGQESLAKNFSTQVVNWDSRLEIRRATLERTYAAMEVRLSALNSQASFLTSQLAGLSTGSDK